MAKVRKKNNRKLRHDRVSRTVVKGLYVVMVGTKMCQIWDSKLNRFRRPNELLTRAICDVTHKWSILVAAFGESEREQYMKSDIVVADIPYLQSSLADYATDKHNELVKRFNPKHFVNVGWIASPEGEDISEEFAGKLFDLRGAWDEKMPAIQFDN